MARRKSLLELAKKFRSSTGSSQSTGSPTKSSIKSLEVSSYKQLKVEPSSTPTPSDSEELDENGNVIKQTKVELNWRRFSDIGAKPQARAADSSAGKRARRRRSQQVRSDRDAAEREPTSSRQPLYPELGDSPDEKSWAKTRKQLQRMTNEELQSLLVSDGALLLDYLIDQKPIIKILERERASVKKQVMSLAVANYAREPEFARDRLKLRAQIEQLAHMISHLKKNHLKPIGLALDELHEIQNKLARDVRELDEQSEKMAKEFLSNGANNKINEAATAAADCCSLSNCTPVSTSCYENFIRNYEHLRKQCNKKRLLADRLAQERDMLLSNMTYKSLILTAKQPQSAINSETTSINSTDGLLISSTTGAGAGNASSATKSTSSLAGDTNREDACSLSSSSQLVGSTTTTTSAEPPKPKPRRQKRAGLCNK